MFVLNAYFCHELRFVAIYAPNSDFYSEIQELTQILLRISEEKFAGWGLCFELFLQLKLHSCLQEAGQLVMSRLPKILNN